MHPEIFSTQGLHPQDQMEGWREWYSPVFELVPKNPMVDGFSAEIQLWKLGGLAMSRTTSPPAHVFRTGRHLRLDPTDHWVISYCVRGAHSATTAGTTIEVPAKIPYLWSLAQDFAHERTGVDRIQFFLSRDAFRDLVPLLDAALGSTLHTPLGLLLGDYMIGARAPSRGCGRQRFFGHQERCRHDDCRRGCPVREACRCRQRSDRSRPQGTRAAGCSSAPAHANLGTKIAGSARRSVTLEPLSAVRRCWGQWPGIFRTSACWRREPSCATRQRLSRFRLSPRISASLMRQVLRALSNESSVAALAMSDMPESESCRLL